MYIKTAEKQIHLKDFHKTANHILFAFENDIESDTFFENSTFEMYSDDDIFLSNYNLNDYIAKINANELYLKNPKIIKDINAYKQEKITMSKQLLADWLENNPMQYSDGKNYSVTSEKQALLNSNLASYERALNAGVSYPLNWNSTGSECVEWEYSDLITLSLTIAAYVAPKVSIQQSIEVAINACETIEELDEIVINYDEN